MLVTDRTLMLNILAFFQKARQKTAESANIYIFMINYNEQMPTTTPAKTVCTPIFLFVTVVT